MQNIVKGSEPKSFTTQKAKGVRCFDDLEKTDLRTSLITDQAYLCCYCMSRIEDNRKMVKIEHWYPESESLKEGDWKRTLDYTNLLLACLGKHGKDDFCDTKKDNKKITINPQNPIHIGKIKYRKDGTIYSDDSNLNLDINEKLNLNAKILKQNRTTIYDIVRGKLTQIKGTCSDATISKMIKKWSMLDNEGKRQEYYMVAVYFLMKKLQR